MSTSVGAPSLKCLSSGRWSDLVPTCDKIECPDIATIVKVGEKGGRERGEERGGRGGGKGGQGGNKGWKLGWRFRTFLRFS